MGSKSSLEELHTRVKSELTVITKLLELARNKQGFIIANEIEEIERVNQEENETLVQLEELGYERQAHVIDVCKAQQLKVTEKLGDLIPQLADIQERESLASLRSELLSLYDQLSECSSLNGELLAQSASISQKLFKRFTHADQQRKNSSYSRFSKKSTSVSSSTPSFHHQG